MLIGWALINSIDSHSTVMLLWYQIVSRRWKRKLRGAEYFTYKFHRFRQRAAITNKRSPWWCITEYDLASCSHRIVFRSSLSTYIGRTHRLVGTYARDQPTNQLTKRVCQHIHHSLQWLEHLKIHPGSPAPSYAWGAQGQLSPMHFPSLRHLFRALNCAQTFFLRWRPLPFHQTWTKWFNASCRSLLGMPSRP